MEVYLQYIGVLEQNNAIFPGHAKFTGLLLFLHHGLKGRLLALQNTLQTSNLRNKSTGEVITAKETEIFFKVAGFFANLLPAMISEQNLAADPLAQKEDERIPKELNKYLSIFQNMARDAGLAEIDMEGILSQYANLVSDSFPNLCAKTRHALANIACTDFLVKGLLYITVPNPYLDKITQPRGIAFYMDENRYLKFQIDFFKFELGRYITPEGLNALCKSFDPSNWNETTIAAWALQRAKNAFVGTNTANKESSNSQAVLHPAIDKGFASRISPSMAETSETQNKKLLAENAELKKENEALEAELEKLRGAMKATSQASTPKKAAPKKKKGSGK